MYIVGKYINNLHSLQNRSENW